ncbi:protein rep, partial [Avibacterium paragallinarum]
AEKPNLSFIFLTLTVKNCPITSLSDTLKWMNQAWNRLIGRKEVKKAVKGFIRATEVTKSGEQAHPHFHVILAVNKSYFTDRTYIKTAQWAELWQDCLQVDYLPLVDARKIRQKGDQIELKAVLETLKYTTKIEHLIEDKDWFLELSDQLFKKRFIATGGCFKDVLKEEVSNEEMIKGEQSEEFDLEEEQEKLKKSLFFGFDHQVKKYKKVKNPHS